VELYQQRRQGLDFFFNIFILRLYHYFFLRGGGGTFARNTEAEFMNVNIVEVSGHSLGVSVTLRARCHSQGPKKVSIPGPNPIPLALVMDLPASKALRTGPYKS
jgi:hypothetical protein